MGFVASLVVVVTSLQLEDSVAGSLAGSAVVVVVAAVELVAVDEQVTVVGIPPGPQLVEAVLVAQVVDESSLDQHP